MAPGKYGNQEGHSVRLPIILICATTVAPLTTDSVPLPAAEV